MSFVSSIDGVKIFYEEIGEGDTVLVFLGGWGVPTAKKVWRHQLSFSSKYKIVLVDLAGHGESGKNRENYTMELFAHDVRAVVEKLDLRNVILIGHSMSGAVILEAERLFPDTIIGLIPLDSLFLNPERPYVGKRDDVIKKIVKPLENEFTSTVTGLFRSFLSDRFDPQDAKEIAKTPLSLDKRSMISAFIELQKWDVHSALPETTKPIKCILAGKDFPQQWRDEYNQFFDAVYLEDVGHLFFIEDPIRFNELLEERISELI
ncbi:MAG: alpha/beta fold hydrolase [Candidatus Thorarchaeota archaeon]|jgi:pimeloyl-ACP methyl ester carboxylesterase